MSKKILIIEDDSKVSFLIELILSKVGYQVVKLEDGDSASKYIAEQQPPDLVLLDIMLPYKDGYQLLQEIRSSQSWKSVPVIILSALAQGKDVTKGLSLEANDYLVKPFQPDELIARIKKYIGQ